MAQVGRRHAPRSRSIDLCSYVRCCQIAAGRWSEVRKRDSRLIVLRELLARFPIKANEVQRLRAAVIFGTFAARLFAESFTFEPRRWAQDSSLDETVQQWRSHLILDEVIAKHEDRSLTLRSLADEFGLSMSYTSRLLTTETGFGFEEHLQGVRISKAVALGKNPKLIFKEIASGAGFRDTSELDRQFKRAFGLTPSACRRAYFSLMDG